MNYESIYKNIIEKRKEHIPLGYSEEHHILPRCLGGTDDKSNLVELTAKEHFICHLLLTKMYPKDSLEYYKMCHAFLMMLKGSKNQQRYITSRKYEKLKVSFSKRMSVLQSGKNNSQHGTMWIHNKTLQECKKVPKDSIIEGGWAKGRIIDWDKNPILTVCEICGAKTPKVDGKRFCGTRCKKEYFLYKSPLSDEELHFIEHFLKNQSISSSLRLINKPVYGSYYNWAKKAIIRYDRLVNSVG